MLRSVDEISSYPRASGIPQLRTAISRWIENRYGTYADPETEIVPTLGSKEAIFSFAQLALGEKRLVAIPEPAYPVYERGARFAGGEVVTRPALGAPRLGARPREDRLLGRDRAVLDLLPEQPDRRGRAAVVLRRPLRPRARARLSRVLGRGVFGALVRRGARVGARARRPHERRRLQHALEAVVDDRLPLGLHLRPARHHGGDQAVPPDGRHRAAGVRPARVGRRLVGRAARQGRARALQPQARRDAAGAREQGLAASPARRRRSISGSMSAARRSRSRAGCSSTASSARPARSSARPARAMRGSRSSRRRPSANAPPRSSRGTSEHHRRDDRRTRPRRGARRRAERRRVAGQRRRAGGDPRLLPASADGAARGRARSSTTTRSR